MCRHKATYIHACTTYIYLCSAKKISAYIHTLRPPTLDRMQAPQPNLRKYCEIATTCSLTLSYLSGSCRCRWATTSLLLSARDHLHTPRISHYYAHTFEGLCERESLPASSHITFAAPSSPSASLSPDRDRNRDAVRKVRMKKSDNRPPIRLPRAEPTRGTHAIYSCSHHSYIHTYTYNYGRWEQLFPKKAEAAMIGYYLYQGWKKVALFGIV